MIMRFDDGEPLMTPAPAPSECACYCGRCDRSGCACPCADHLAPATPSATLTTVEELDRDHPAMMRMAREHLEETEALVARAEKAEREVERLRKVIQYVIDSERLDGAEEEYVRNELIR